MNKIISSNEEDIKLFNQILRDNVAMLIGKSDKVTIDLFVSKILNRIRDVHIYDWKDRDEYVNESCHGFTDFLTDNPQIKMYGTTGYKGEKEYIERIFSHELWHAIMFDFCKSYGSYFKRKIFRVQDTTEVTNYVGFLKCDTESSSYTPGYMMADSLANLLALSVVKKRNNPNFCIDDIFKNRIDDESLNSPIDDLLTFHQLFIASFSLDNSDWMDENYNNGKGLLDSTSVLKDGKYSKNNIFITESLRNPISVMDEYDKYMGVGSYIELQNTIDRLYKEYVDNGIIKTREFIKVADTLDDFTFERLHDYNKKGIISIAEFAELFSNFIELHNAFLDELHVYKVKKSKQKFKKIVNRILNLK